MLTQEQEQIKKDGTELLDRIIKEGYNIREIIKADGKKRGIVYFPKVGPTVFFSNFKELLEYKSLYFNLTNNNNEV